jgi:hypothetical protein
MPGIREALEAGRWEEANVQAGRLAQALKAYVARAEEATRLARSL